MRNIRIPGDLSVFVADVAQLYLSETTKLVLILKSSVKMKEKMFKTAPLPFQGQKRRFAGAFVSLMQEIKEKGTQTVFVDLFGGSGLLSHIAKRINPNCKVVYNDFDNYTQRLRNIDKTNRLLKDIREVLSNYPDSKKVNEEKRSIILKIIEVEDRSGYVDYITLSASILFSSKYVTSFLELKKEAFYNRIKAEPYNFNVDEYLCGLDIVCADYKELYLMYRNVPGVYFIIDPPYLSTDTKTYSSDKYWKLKDYLDVLSVLVDSNYIFFTSNKSSLIDLCEWFDENRRIGNPFKNSVLNTHQVTLNRNSKYMDMMLYKFVK